MKQKKRRPSYADESTRLVVRLREYCCEHGLIFQGEPSEDCGVDCYIEVATNGSPHNFIVGVQCKTGQSYRRTSKEGVRVSVRQVDVDYWLAANYPLVLAYWDDIEGRGYFKHIQDHIEKTLSKRSHAIQDITFFDADRFDGDQLASYVRNLVVQTPSASSRLAVLRGGASMLTESGKISLTKVRGCSFDPSALLDQWRVAWQDAGSPAQVLAFSNDDRWVMEMYRRPLGMTGVDDVTVVLRDLVFFRAVTLNLYTYEDFVKDGEGFASSAIAPARLEEFLEQCFSSLGADATINIRRMMASGLREKPGPVFHGSHFFIRRRKVKPAQARKRNGTSTHGTGFERYMEIAIHKALGVQFARGLADRQKLGMGGGVFQFQRAVTGLCYYGARLIRHHGTHRHFAARRCCFGFSEGQ